LKYRVWIFAVSQVCKPDCRCHWIWARKTQGHSRRWIWHL